MIFEVFENLLGQSDRYITPSGCSIFKVFLKNEYYELLSSERSADEMKEIQLNLLSDIQRKETKYDLVMETISSHNPNKVQKMPIIDEENMQNASNDKYHEFILYVQKNSTLKLILLWIHEEDSEALKYDNLVKFVSCKQLFKK